MFDLKLGELLLHHPRLHVLANEVAASQLEPTIAALRELLRPQFDETRRVALLLRDAPQFIACLLSTISLGRPAVLLNPALTPTEVGAAIDIADIGMLAAPADYPLDVALASFHPRLLAEVPAPPSAPLRVWTLDKTPRPKNTRSVPSNDAEFIVQFTSGVSGTPSAVTRTYAQARNELECYIPRVRLARDDVIVCAVPLYHSFGLFAGLLASLCVDARLVIMPTFSPTHLALVTQRYRPSIFLGVPLMYEVLGETSAANEIDLSCYRILLSAGGPLSPQVSAKFKTKFGVPITQLYGTTETGVIALNFPADNGDAPLTVGKPLAQRSVRILDEAGADVETGRDGEIALASPATTSGYLMRPELTRSKFRNGWYFTGDLGRIDPQGRLYVTGRKSTFINVAGLKVDPSEVEHVILDSGEAVECAVVGIPREQHGEFIRAYIVMKPNGDLDRLRAHCRLQLASFKMPREFSCVAALPRTETGKVLRKYLMQ